MRADRLDVEGVAAGRAEPRHGHDARCALRRQHAVHRIGRDRHERRRAGRQVCLGHQVEHLVGARAHDDFSRLDPGVGGGRLRQLGVGRIRVFVERRIKRSAQGLGQPAGAAGDVLVSKRRMSSARSP